MKAINEGIERVCLRRLDLPFDEITLDQLIGLCKNFLIVNSTRSLPNFTGAVTYATAELRWDGDKLTVLRRRIKDFSDKIIGGIPGAVEKLGKSSVPIHEVRAIVCYDLKLNDVTFDTVVGRIVSGDLRPKDQLTVLDHIVAPLPPSEKPLNFNGTNYYMMTLSQEAEAVVA